MTLILKLARVSPSRFSASEPVPWPAYKTAGAAGMDLYADVDEGGVTVPPGCVVAIPTGLKMEIPAGYEGQVRPRGGLAFKSSISVINSPGTVDADFRGEVMIGLVNHGREPFQVRRGDRVAQLVICPVALPEVLHVQETELTDTVRGAGAFGSTGINDATAKR